MSKIRHILFDCDGVLVDTEYTAAVKMCAALEDSGVNISLEHYLREYSGTTFSGILEHYFGDTMSTTEKARLMRRVEAEVAACVKSVPGMPELLSSFDVDKSVVSNSSIPTVRHALAETGISKHFDGRIFSSEQVPRAKPAPDLYLFTLEALRLQPEEILVVEDSRTGVQAAINAGLRVVGFTGASHILSGHDEKLQALGVEYIAPNTEALQRVIRAYLD